MKNTLRNLLVGACLLAPGAYAGVILDISGTTGDGNPFEVSHTFASIPVDGDSYGFTLSDIVIDPLVGIGGTEALTTGSALTAPKVDVSIVGGTAFYDMDEFAFWPGTAFDPNTTPDTALAGAEFSFPTGSEIGTHTSGSATLTISTVADAPEPSTILLLASGLVGFATLRRKIYS